MAVQFMHTPTFETTTAEAFEPYVLEWTGGNNYYGISAKGRGGKPSLRASSQYTFKLTTPAAMGDALSRPFRMTFDVQFDTFRADTGGAVFLRANAPSTTYPIELYANGNGALKVVFANQTLPLFEGILKIGVPHTIEIEAVTVTDAAVGYLKIWVDKALVVDFKGKTAYSSSGQTISAIAFFHETAVANGSTGTHFSNILVYDDVEGRGEPKGALDFSYVPVTDAALSEPQTNDSSASITFSDSAYREFTLPDITDPEKVIAYAPSVRAATINENPGLLDVRLGNDVIIPKRAVTTNFTNIRVPGKTGPVPSKTFAIRNAAAAS